MNFNILHQLFKSIIMKLIDWYIALIKDIVLNITFNKLTKQKRIERTIIKLTETV